MAGVVLETLSTKKLIVLSVSLLILLTVFFLIGGLIAPAPNNVINSIAVKCYDKEELWRIGTVKPFLPRGTNSCEHVETFHDKAIQEEHIDPNMIIFSQWFPLPRDNKQLDMSRWFQNIISVLQVDIRVDKKYPDPLDKPLMRLETNLFYRDKEDGENDWKLLTSSTTDRRLECILDEEESEEGDLYHCDPIPYFELGSVHYDYYLINLRLPIHSKSDINKLGPLEDVHIVAIFQNGGFTKVWFSIKTAMFPIVLAVLIWFWHRVMTEGRDTNVMDRTLFSLGVILTILNCPIEWFTLAINMPFMMLLNDIRDGAFYAMLLSFWLIFVGEHTLDQVERNKLSSYWKELLLVILGCSALFIFEMCERGTQLANPFSSIWSTDAGTTAALGFIIVAGTAACIYFLFLCYLVFKVFRSIRVKQSALISMSSLRRQYYSGIIYRFKFLMMVTLICSALTVIYFIIGQVSENRWKWGDEDVSLEYTSAFLTGTYGMWNVYVIAMLCLYAPSHKKYATGSVPNADDSNSQEEEVQLTQMSSEGQSVATFISKAAAD